MYENEDLTPDERNAVWMDLEKKYRPDLDAGDLPFYSRGAGWQRQLHIYLYPLYYIDYCMAQSVAFGFWCLAMEDEKEAFRRYLTFVDMAGTRTFAQLVTEAGLPLPYAEGTMKAVSETVGAWLAKKEEEYKNR
jgi:oligoendopeptidase F